MNINRLDLTILTILAKEECFTELNGMTINEINSFNGDNLACRMQMIRRINHLIELGYIQKGIKDNKADTFFILNDGLKAIKWKEVVAHAQ